MVSLAPLQVAVIGAGYWGPNLIRNFNALDDSQVRWVCDRKAGRLQYIRERFPQLPLTDDWERVLSDPDVDAVAIATPVSTHRALAIAALRAGKHVFVEKPLAEQTASAQEIARVAEETGRVLAVGHIFVYHPAVAAMYELIAAGRIGRLCYAESSRVNLGPPASEVNVIWDLAVHDVAVLLYLWQQEPVEVTAFGNRYKHGSLLDAAFLNVRFADGSMAQHHVGWLTPEKQRRLFVAGTKGSLVFDDTLSEGKLRYIDQGEDSRIGLGDEESKELFYRPVQARSIELPSEEPLRAECRHFLECIRTGKRPRADGSAGVAVVRVLEAANESIEQGSIAVPLDVGAYVPI